MQIAYKHTSPDGLLQEFTELLSERMGLYYPKERWNDLEKKLYPLMRSLGFTDVAPCIEWLRDHLTLEQQIAELAYYLTIGETYFFRDARLFTALENEILPAIIARRQRERKLTIWSAGCCSGEEAYSIAILLHRLIPDLSRWNIRLVGTDINQEFLRKAELGRYHRWSFRSTPKQTLATYFTDNGQGVFQIIPEIQQLVSFRCANLVDDDRPETSQFRQEMDLVICNNVLIYFSQKQIDKTIRRLVQALVTDGWLTVTPIEAPYVKHPQLVNHPVANAIFFQKKSNSTSKPSPAASLAVPLLQDTSVPVFNVILPELLHASEPKDIYLPNADNAVTSTASPKKAIELSERAHLYALYEAKRYTEVIAELAPRLEALRDDPRLLGQHIPEVILLIRIYSNQAQGDLALEWCERALQADTVNPILQYLKAEIKSAFNDVPGAIDSLKKALFLDPNFIAALYLYGQLETKAGHRNSAAKAFQRALKLLETYPADSPLIGTEELVASQVKAHVLSSLRESNG